MPTSRARRRAGLGAASAVALIALGSVPAAAQDGEGLVLGPIAPVEGVKPGSGFELPVTFRNEGTEALDKVWLTYAVTQGLAHTELPSNCVRYDIPSADESPRNSMAQCEYVQPIEAGAVYAPEKPLALNAQDWALHDVVHVSVARYGEGPGDSGAQPVRGTGPAQKLVKQTSDGAGFSQRLVTVPVNADSTADFQVTGARLKARAGDTVSAELSFRNAGPGWVLSEAGIPAHEVTVTLPAGTKAARVADLCNATDDPRRFTCGSWNHWVEEDRVERLTFRLKVEKLMPGAKGTVALTGGPRPFDKSAANDTAEIVVEAADGTSGGGSATGGSATGGSGGSGGSESGGGSATGGSGGAGGSSSSTGGSTGSASAGGSSSSTGGGTGSATTGGNLASTGSGSALPVAAGAAAAVVAGTGVVVAMRRRAARTQ
ncbi:hypothetical protein HW130_19585 [Streptomyces sp. PKU-EA00015]|uniref:hypothetical protein n=1 Tax=Streptomyces sp. PKU-EA00015 TaxID=2748326 RepID=UPI0015A202C1|nr:hypothetical protein [Streptomyces sp. PKU-EA00015]NWF28443.1 hypothetical protein [Streptomyces sp. PKU-EA00015]